MKEGTANWKMKHTLGLRDVEERVNIPKLTSHVEETLDSLFVTRTSLVEVHAISAGLLILNHLEIVRGETEWL